MRGIMVGTFLIILGLAIFVYGMNLAESRNPLSSVYCAAIGVFIGIAGFLILCSHLFRGSSIFV